MINTYHGFTVGPFAFNDLINLQTFKLSGAMDIVTPSKSSFGSFPSTSALERLEISANLEAQPGSFAGEFYLNQR